MHFQALIIDLAVILGVAAIVTFIFKRINQPVVLGYVIAGILVGPLRPPFLSIREVESVKIWAELGVVFLMFALGLEFSFRRLAKVGASASTTAIIQIITMLSLGVTTAKLLGWSNMDAIFLGCMISISSTTIIVKTFDELNLKAKRFAETVFGILIIEDLAAILMLVGLTNVVMFSRITGMELLLAAGKLALIIGAWFLIGIFVVPRFVRAVDRYGNDEVLTVVSIALCLLLVVVAAYFHYSIALGAFIMGSILAESIAAKRIAHLIQPLKDVFGAVFFVSVGMLLDPQAIMNNMGTIAIISAVIISGQILSVTSGAFLTGQSMKSAIRTGFSMAQIGEFSYIIGSLGVAYHAIREELYPIIIAVSLITTFTTPYLVRTSARVADLLEARLPLRMRILIDSYTKRIQRYSLYSDRRKGLSKGMVTWILNAIVVIILFKLSADQLVPLARKYIPQVFLARAAAWTIGFAFSAPSIWGMLSTTFRSPAVSGDGSGLSPYEGARIISRILTIALIGILSTEYFPVLHTLVVTLGVYGTLFLFFRHQIEGYYQWIEVQFKSGFQADEKTENKSQLHERLAPWDAHLIEVKVPTRSPIIGKSLLELKLRENYGINVVIIIRNGENNIAPRASEILYPGDRILCFATDSEVERFEEDIQVRPDYNNYTPEADAHSLQCFKVKKSCPLNNVSIRMSGIREKFDCIVVGMERAGERIRSPKADLSFLENDVIWIAGEKRQLHRLARVFE
jgi:CPA2 family monovalent cation:H+ antiporter-2